MKRIIADNKFFNIVDTLECGQIFRFAPFNEGYKAYTKDKCAYLYEKEKNIVIECMDSDAEYFNNFFDLDRDYASIYNGALESGVEVLKISAEKGKGIRILKQDCIEMLFSFIVSQNNNIPRIKKTIERLCVGLGEKREFLGEYNAFPTVKKMAEAPLDFYKEIGLGYRAEYISGLAKLIDGGMDIEALRELPTQELKKQLLKIKGIGEKVANCVLLFGFNRSDSFPVDTWIEKVYRESFNGKEKDINKITSYFLNLFKENAGYYQQYLFYYKRTLEKAH